MWRNLKISTKLSLGFGLIVVVFLVSVFVTWRYIKVVDYGSELMANRIVPAMDLVSLYNNGAYEAFMSMIAVQYSERKEVIEDFRDHVTMVVNVRNNITEMLKTYSDLPALNHVVNTVQPIAAKFVELSNGSITLIDKKHSIENELTSNAAHLTTITREVMDSFHIKLEDSIKKLDLESDRTETMRIEQVLYQISVLLENVTVVRRDTWHAIFNAQTLGDISKIQDLGAKMSSLRKETDEIRIYLHTPEELGMLDRILAEFERFAASLGEYMKTCVELSQIHNERAKVMESFSIETKAALDMAINRVRKVSSDNMGYLGNVIFMLLLSSVISIVLGIIVVIFISRSISKPLNTIVSIAQRAGEGDLTIKKADFGYEGKDEMGSMVNALSDMVGSQNMTMTHIVDIAKSLTEGAGNLSAISEETNATMEEIRASVSQVSSLSESNGSALEESNAGVEEMSAGADNVAHSATDSAAFISQTTEASNKAIQKVRNVIEGMHDVDKNSKESEGKIKQLVSSVDNVSSFVSVITGIADQTNLLALNAAIEAARAGEVGRGFAVVAEEVRKLAEESAQAARNVNEIIKELQGGAQASIKSTTDAGRLLASTLENAGHALDELNGAMDQMNKANDSIQNIAAIAEEQAASSKEVAQSIDNATKSSVNMITAVSSINQATNETSQATEGVAKQAENMMSASKILSELLSNFKLDIVSQPASPAKTKMLATR